MERKSINKNLVNVFQNCALFHRIICTIFTVKRTYNEVDKYSAYSDIGEKK